MKLGLMVGYWMMGPEDPIERVLIAEDLGYESVWTAEAYGSDAISPLCWLGARTKRIKLGTSVMQLSARSPAMAAMTAMTIDHLSSGRFILGIGVSGPQVVEGWYGQPFPRPMERTREFVSLFREIMRREGPVEFEGNHFQLPLDGGAGLGKPLKLITKPLRSEIPIYIGAEGPKNVKQTTEIADGWLPLFYSPYRNDIYADSLSELRPGFDIAATVNVVVNDDLEAARLPVKWMLSFYMAGMGARKQNFHANLLERMGFGDAISKVDELFWAGKREEAIAAVPDEIVDELALVGPVERIKERAQAWRDSPVTTILVAPSSPDARPVLETMADIFL
ncbi:MAG: LLM class F420-dependent oxidoreductase [Deltaproteobacteria bacterium]